MTHHLKHSKMQNQRIGQILMDHDIIDKDQLELALIDQQNNGGFLGDALVRLGFIRSEEVILPFISEQRAVQYMRLQYRTIPTDALRKISAKVALQYTVMPLLFYKDTLTLAMNSPFDRQVQAEISKIINLEVKPVLAGRDEINKSIREYYGIPVPTQ